ncbi:hypothetical protein G0U57_012060, partial [Chelydra serpentina]
DNWHDWNVTITGCKLFRKTGEGTFYTEGIITCFQVIDNSEPQDLECTWVNVLMYKVQGGVLVGICCRPLNHSREQNELFLQQRSLIAGKKNCVVMGDFSWETYTGGFNQTSVSF